MADIVQVTGFILSSMPVGEYDRRIVILSKEPLNVTVVGILILYSKQRLRITLRNS